MPRTRCRVLSGSESKDWLRIGTCDACCHGSSDPLLRLRPVPLGTVIFKRMLLLLVLKEVTAVVFGFPGWK